MLSKLILIICLWAVIALAQEPIAVIAHKSVPVDEINKSELLDFYTGDVRTWPGGKAVVVFDLKSPDDLRDMFYDFLGKSSSRMKSIWMKRMLSGEGDPPEALNTDNDMLNKVSGTAGAVGFVPADKVNSKVKVLLNINISDN